MSLLPQSPELNGPNGSYIDNGNNNLIVVSYGAFSKPYGTMKIIDLKKIVI
jgi:hypothetical protein